MHPTMTGPATTPEPGANTPINAAPKASRWRRARFTSGLAVVILILLIAVGWSFVILQKHESQQHTRQLNIQQLTGAIRHLDEVLTMSARMAAATGDLKWEDRYRSFEPKLDAAIKELIAISPEAFDSEVGRETDEANQQLVAMETRSFELVRAGDTAGARIELFSGAYELQKVKYAQGMAVAEAELRRLVSSEDDAVQARLRIITAASMASIVSVLTIGGVWLRIARRRAERDAQVAQERLELIELGTRAKSEFLANMSHEIRTPMTAIVGYAELLTDPLQPAQERANCVQIIRRNGEHLLTIVNDILDLSKIEAGKMTVERIACSPVQIVHEVLSLMRIRAKTADISLLSDLQFPIPRTIDSDPVRLRQIILNLVGNSIKFTKQGSVTVALKLQSPHEADSSAQLVFEIRDTGIGMTDEQVAKLFRPFTQADSSMSRRFGGTGLGLTISRRLIEILGGSIEVSSTIGAGSTFTVTLPVACSADADLIRLESEVAIVAEAPPSDAPVAPVRLHGRILLAEDGVDNQRLLTLHLRKAGAEVMVVENGRIAIDQILDPLRPLGAAPFDLILMDMQMPDMDGYTATSILRQRGFTGPIVALTAHAMQGDRERCLSAGCTDYLTKPINKERLLSVCHEHMTHRRAA
jgi:signal transduction histidine kinase/ActR/RegA family two-component response regulator